MAQIQDTGKRYICIDLKSFYASVELAARKRDPLTTNLVVADESRTEKTICLAVSPSLKALGISGRARLFEVVQRVREVNAQRSRKARALGLLERDPETGKERFRGASDDANALEADPALEISYIVAPPRMKLYEQVSTQIFSIYLKYISEEDIHVYSIDECFMDVTGYLKTYGTTPHELAMRMIRDVLQQTGITATAGIGTNLYLAKIAMDIVAKHVPADADGVRIAELDEMRYRELLWCHRPLTDFWRVGRGTARRLEGLGCRTMGDVARLSMKDEGRLYGALGINAELLIDHAWGWEPTDISAIKSYQPENRSLSSGQVLAEPYDAEKGKLIVREMTELLVLDLVRKGAVTKQVTLTVHYDRSSILPGPGEAWTVAKTGARYRGRVGTDYYGRPAPKYAHGTGNLDRWTSSGQMIVGGMMALYDRIVDPDLTIRRVNVTAENILPEEQIPAEGPQQMSLFVDYEAEEKKERARKAAEEKERRLQRATLKLHEKFGKNSLLKGMNLMEGGTTIARNRQIGGHSAGTEPEESRADAERQAAAETDRDAEKRTDESMPEGGDWA